MEALRLHELATLVERVESDGQVFDYELKLPELSERWLQVNAAAISTPPANAKAHPRLS